MKKNTSSSKPGSKSGSKSSSGRNAGSALGKSRAPSRAPSRSAPPSRGRSGGGKPAFEGSGLRRQGRPGAAMAFRESFDELWRKLFSSPVHLDSALSHAPPSVKGTLAPLTRVLLQRPSSLAHYLKFKLATDEPWGLSPERLAEWPTAREMAKRLQQSFERDKNFTDEGFPVESDFPPNMIEEWKREFGKKNCDELVKVLGSPAPLALRATRRKGRDQVLSALNDSNEIPIRARSSNTTPYGFSFDEYTPVLGHPMFKAGDYEIQDEGSQMMALFALWPETFASMTRKVPGPCREWPRDKEVPKAPGTWTVIDACAGAGGKTLALADAMFGRGQVFAYDVSVKKLESLRQRATRAGLSNIKAVALPEGDEDAATKKFHGKADRVLVDAPCSGWGVLRRNPDQKWRQDPDSYERLEALQARLLDVYSKLVKTGGMLTYGVCTFRSAETTKQVEAFLSRHPEFETVGGGYFGPGPTDGFFFHAFRRK
jgi:16S rRNA C967 or C1407 C5-methylase (RsmB/RsmF family)